MKRTLGRARATRTNSSRLLSTLLETPNLERSIQALSPAALRRVVDRVGLEDAAEIVALASTAQLVAVLDEDLWNSDRPGENEEFDAARFVTWLGVLQEAGEAFAAERVAELSLDFVSLAFNQLLLVLNVDVMVDELDGGGDEVDRIEKALEDHAYEELDEFQLIARVANGWDAVWSLILALDRDHRDFLRQVLERCCRASHSYVEDNGGLYEVLSDEEMFLSDARAERDDRRAARGHVAASDAKSFLALSAAEPPGESSERDAVTRAYFRELEPEASFVATPRNQRHAGGRRIERLLSAIEAEEAPRVARLPSGADARLPLSVALDELAGDVLVARYREELAYLANVLIAGASLAGRRFRPVEALEAALAVANLGLELGPEFAGARASELLRRTSADVLFRRGFYALRREIVEPLRAQEPTSSLAEDVPRVAGAAGLGFVATKAQLARAVRSLRKRGQAQRSARVNGSSQ